MKISFDLDGVLADTDRWFFRLLDLHDSIDVTTMEKDYFSSRPLKHHPDYFMSKDDQGYIITARKPSSKESTEEWLRKYRIDLPITYVDSNGDIDWSNYKKASIMVGKRKLEMLKTLTIDIHFDNNPYIVEVIRNNGICAILVGRG